MRAETTAILMLDHGNLKVGRPGAELETDHDGRPFMRPVGITGLKTLITWDKREPSFGGKDIIIDGLDARFDFESMIVNQS